MMPIRRWSGIRPTRVILVLVVVLSGSAYAYWRGSRATGVSQPIAFNHRLHVKDAEIACSDCHPYYEHGSRSGLPDKEVCATCHSEALSDSAAEAKLLARIADGKALGFRKLFHLPEHVFYSHRRHVVLGELACSRCHGGIAETEHPPTSPLIEMSMDFCMDCHEQSKVTNECKSCHR